MRSIFLSGLALTAIANGAALAQPSPESVPSISASQAAAKDAGHASIPIVIWAPSKGQGLGLIVISHGTGAGPAAHIDTAQELAKAGFVWWHRCILGTISKTTPQLVSHSGLSTDPATCLGSSITC